LGLSIVQSLEESIAFIASEQNKNVLELGVGEGRDALYLANCGFSLTGVDIVVEGLKKLTKMSEKNNFILKQFWFCLARKLRMCRNMLFQSVRRVFQAGNG